MWERTAYAEPPQSEPAESTTSVVVLPTLTPTGDQLAEGKVRRPTSKDGALWLRARELDNLLRETIQDLGLVVDLTGSHRESNADGSERDLLVRSKTARSWYLAPRIEVDDTHIVVRLMLVPPGAGYAIVRTETMPADDFELRTVIMLRDIVNAGTANAGTRQPTVGVEPASPTAGLARSQDRFAQGRAVLAVHSAMFGGYVGYSFQRIGGSNDARLTYPMVALGAVVGLGGSLIVAQEWNIGIGDAWYLSAGMVWPALGSWMLAKGRDVQPASDRHTWGVVGGFAGVTLASFSLSFAGMSTGGAVVAQSGGLLGMALGAGTELAIRGRTDVTPYQGIGYGAIAGVLVGGTMGRWVQDSPARTVMIDIGAGIGALSLAAVGSPLLISDATEQRQRIWVLLTMSGAIAGGATAYWMTQSASGARTTAGLPINGHPIAGVMGQSQRADGAFVPIYGAGWSGRF